MKYAGAARSTLAAALAVALSACGGGGGGGGNAIRPDPPAPVTPPTPPTPPPPTTPPPGSPAQPSLQGHLDVINALGTGLSGQGVRIGIVDSGVNRNHPTLAGRVVGSYTYVDPTRNNTTRDDVVGHGTTVAGLAAGGRWQGAQMGVAPGAQIVSARIIADTRPSDDGSGSGNEVKGGVGLAPVHRDLIAAGVKIMNNSWGGLYWTDLPTTAAIAEEYRSFIRDNNGLVVFATGNDGRADPSNMAALPSRFGVNGSRPGADLSTGWLAVTAVDTVNWSQHASYANACGEAADYCLAAPGTAVYLDPQAGAAATADASMYYGWGTSYAAPLVSGAAALVWERYPWMSNDLLRQTLLGTATDLGVAGVDPVFGHGLLNVAKAVNGPERLSWGQSVATINQLGLDSVWRNDLQGSGGLTKRGQGALTLEDSTSRYEGPTLIEAGTLALRNASIISDVTISKPTGAPTGAALQFLSGSANVNGNVDNGGALIANSASSQAWIRGDYLQREGAQLVVALGSNAVQVTGKVTLQGGGVAVNGVIAGYTPADGSRQTLLEALGGVSGRFSQAPVTLNGLSLLQADYGYDTYSTWLDIQRVSVTAAAATARLDATAQGSATRVERAFEQLDADVSLQGSVFAAAAGQLQLGTVGAAGLGASLDSLAGKAHGRALAATLDSVAMSHRAVAARWDALQAQPQQLGQWASRLGEAGQGGGSGQEMQMQGWMVGQETRLGQAGVLGMAFGEVRAAAVVGLERGRERMAQAQLYAGWQLGRGYALAQFGSGQFQRTIDRQLLLGSAAVATGARYGGRASSFSVETGLHLGDARAQLVPFAGFSQTQVHSDGFNESGGLGFGLRSMASDARRSVASAGLRGHWQWQRWLLRGHGQWQQQVGGNGLTAQAGFTGIDSWAPLAEGDWRRGSALFGFSAETTLGRLGRLSFGVDQRLGGDSRTGQAALQYSTAF